MFGTKKLVKKKPTTGQRFSGRYILETAGEPGVPYIPQKSFAKRSTQAILGFDLWQCTLHGGRIQDCGEELAACREFVRG